MKRLLFLIFVLSATGAYAQDVDLKINNLRLFGDYKTAEEIFEALGEKPTKIRTPQPTDKIPLYTFFFGEDTIEWLEGDIFDMRLKSNKFALNGVIRVGDKISDLKKLGGYIHNELGDYIIWFPSDDLSKYEWLQVWIGRSKENIITSISISITNAEP